MTCHEFERRLSDSWPPDEWRGLEIVVAVSGGADSVALLRALAAVAVEPQRLLIAHFNHGWRGADSDADAQFVAELSARLRLRLQLGRPPVGAAPQLDEATARTQRREFLAAVAGEVGARYVVTAHTADDQAETVLHHIVRGTGLAGLAGMSRTSRLGPATLLRPMLTIRRSEVIAYLDAIGQEFRQDVTNADRRWTRNRLRHELLPHLTEHYNSEVVAALGRLARLAGEAQGILSVEAQTLAESAVTPAPPGGFTIDAERLRGQPRYLLREMLVGLWRAHGLSQVDMSFEHWDAMAELIATARPGATGAFTLPGAVQVRHAGSQVTMTRPVDRPGGRKA